MCDDVQCSRFLNRHSNIMYDPLPWCIRTAPYYAAVSLAVHDLCSACSQCAWIFPDHCRFHTVPWLSMKICCGLETCLLLICVCYCLPQFGHRWRRKTKHNRVQPHLVALGLRRCHKFPCDIMQRPAACHDSWRSSCLFAAASTSKPMGNAAGHHDVLSCIVTHLFYNSMHVSFFSTYIDSSSPKLLSLAQHASHGVTLSSRTQLLGGTTIAGCIVPHFIAAFTLYSSTPSNPLMLRFVSSSLVRLCTCFRNSSEAFTSLQV